MTWDIREAVETFRKTHVEGEPLTTADVELDLIDDVQEAIRCWEDADELVRAATAVKAAAAIRVGQLLGKGGATRSGNRIIRYRHDGKHKCVDPAGVIGYLTQQVKADLVNLGDIVNPQYIKRGWMDDAVKDTFYEWVPDDEPTVKATAREYAPKFLQALDDGDVI